MKPKLTLKPIALINMIPFIDIMLVILIVLILATVNTFYNQFNIQVPNSSIGQHIKRKPPLTIYINQQGKYFLISQQLQKQALPSSALVKSLANHHSLAILAAPLTPYKNIIQLITTAKQQQIKQINLVVQSKQFK